ALLEAERCTVMAGRDQGGTGPHHSHLRHARHGLRKGDHPPLYDRHLRSVEPGVGLFGIHQKGTGLARARLAEPPAERAADGERARAGMTVPSADPGTGRPVEPGTQGEILVKGATLMEGYYRVPRAESFDGDGFFLTGALGWLDAEGCLHFAARLKDVIKTAG